jgi:hypothetical protein
VDDDDGTIEIQQFDGTIGEYEIEHSPTLLLVEVSAPDDWSGSVDMDPEDYVGQNQNDIPPGYHDPLAFLDKNGTQLHAVRSDNVDHSVPHRYIQFSQSLSRPGAGEAVTCFDPVCRTMRCTDDRGFVFGQELVRQPVQWMANMHTDVLIGEHVVAAPYHKTSKWPVPLTDQKLSAARILQFCYRANFNLTLAH